MKAILNELYQHKRLSKSQAKQILIDIASEKYNAAHLASFMTVFMMRPITVEELAGFRDALIELAVKVDYLPIIPLILLVLEEMEKILLIFQHSLPLLLRVQVRK